MASGDLDIPQVAAVGLLDGNNHPTPTQTLPCPSSDSSHPPPSPDGHATSPTDDHLVSVPAPILRTGQISSDAIDSPFPASRTSDMSSSRPPSPASSAHSTGSIQFPVSTVLRDDNSDEHDGPSTSLELSSPSLHDRPKENIATVSGIGSSSAGREIEAELSSSSLHDLPKEDIATVSGIGSSSAEREIEADQSLRLSPVCSAQSDVASSPPSPTHTHVDTSSGVISHPSSTASFFRDTLHRIRQPSPSPSGKTYTDSNATQSDGQKGDNADVKHRRARPPLLNLFQEQDLDVRPFAFNPLQLVSLFAPRNLETLEAMGGVDAILRALGTHPTHGLSTELGPPGPASQVREYTTDKDSPMLNTITSPVAMPQGLQSISLAGSTGVRPPMAFQFFEDAYRASIEDRQRIFGRNIIPQNATKTLLQLVWLALKDKVLVC